MNYTSAAIGLVTLLSIVTWFTTAAKNFAGPSDVRDLIVEGVENPPEEPAKVIEAGEMKCTT